MKLIRHIFASTVVASLLTCSVKTPAQAPTPAATTTSPQPTAPANHPALWVVKGPRGTVYLFGTVHLLRKDVQWHSPSLDAALTASQSLWLEITDADDQAVMQSLMMKLGVDADHPLSTKLDKATLAQVDAGAKKMGIAAGEQALEPLRPWAVGLTFTALPLVNAGYDPNSGVEHQLKQQFLAAHKPVNGLETSEQQLHFFADMPLDKEVHFLQSSLKESTDSAAKLDTVVQLWQSGDVDGVEKNIDAVLRDTDPDLYQLLLVHRNQSWIPKITTLLNQPGTTFIAVGAGHLAGPDGVPALLEKAGYTPQRM